MNYSASAFLCATKSMMITVSLQFFTVIVVVLVFETTNRLIV